MAIELNSKFTNALADILHTTDETKKIVAYNALAYVIVNTKFLNANIDDLNNQAEWKIKINILIEEIAQKIILDRTLLASIVMKFYSYYKERLTFRDTAACIVQANCFVDILGPGVFFSRDDILLINDNFDLFKLTAKAACSFFAKKDFTPGMELEGM